jgi:transposase InsO family protein
MKDIYQIAGISKQAYHKYLQRSAWSYKVQHEVIANFNQIRKSHPRMSCRKMYHVKGYRFPVGRDLSELIGFANGFKVRKIRNPVKTTWSQRVEVYPNLIEGLVINNVNQVWQSDIFYLNFYGKNYYVVVIQDIYSRYLLALHVSNSLNAEQNVRALKKAFKTRGVDAVRGCIFHSDRGSQYISKQHKDLLKEYGMRISMCKLPQQNAYVERLNGILKHEYYYAGQRRSQDVRSYTKRIQRLYNYQRPHEELNNKTPHDFEEQIDAMVDTQRPKLSVYEWDAPLSTENQDINKEKRSKKEN